MYDLEVTADSSHTFFSSQYHQHYHSTKEGALFESITKHVAPVFAHHHDKKILSIVDICFGLGYNTLATLWYNQAYNHNKRIVIFTPELDDTLLERLYDFEYPDIFEHFIPILFALLNKGNYKDDRHDITLFRGDARVFIATLRPNSIDAVYHDAFSYTQNPLLWTVEYFEAIKKLLKEDAIVTTYSTAFSVRKALFDNGFYVYVAQEEGARNFTLATRKAYVEYTLVDMPHKIACNPDKKALYDKDFI